MKALIIAEKPSLAQNIAKAISNTGEHMKSNNGYLESENYIITFAFGHLMSLYNIEEYDPSYDPNAKLRWTMDNLPFIPEEFKFGLRKDPKTKKVDAGIKKQFLIIKTLINRGEVGTIVHAGDAGREGEVIVRLIIMACGNSKPVKRLWLPDQTEKTILSEITKMRDDSDYDNLADEGMARMYVDWLYGINLTRYISIKSKGLLRIGRVIGAIVKAIYDRDREIENFKPETYFIIESNTEEKGERLVLTSSILYKTKEEAIEAANLYNAQSAMVSAKNTERKIIGAGKLYSLSKLQGVLAEKYKIPLKESMTIIQNLYEKGYLTYPRTNTEYLSENEKDKVKEILAKLKKAGYGVVFKDSKTIFDDRKVEEHSAITPTLNIPDITALSDKEKLIYMTIMNRFLAVFCEENCEVDRTIMMFSIGDIEDIQVKGDIAITAGWKAIENIKTEDKILPNLNKGDIVKVEFKPVEKQTQPPRPYTNKTLLNFLENPFKTEKKESDEEKYKNLFDGIEIGTEATRTGIIQNALDFGYISCVKDIYHILPNGVFLIEVLEKLGIDMSKHKTVEFSQSLKSVYRSEISVDECIQRTAVEIRSIFENGKNIEVPSVQQASGNTFTSIGKCPMCGKDVVEGKNGYGCIGYRDTPPCKFIIWKKSKYFDAIGLKLTKKLVVDFLKTGRSGPIKMISKKSGKEYSAIIVMNAQEDGTISYSMEFPTKKDG